MKVLLLSSETSSITAFDNEIMLQNVFGLHPFWNRDFDKVVNEVFGTVCHRVPVGREVLKLPPLNRVKQLVLVPLQTAEGGKPTEEDVSYHAYGPIVNVQAIPNYNNNQT